MFTRSSFNYNGPLWFLLLGRIVDETLFLGLGHGPIFYSPTAVFFTNAAVGLAYNRDSKRNSKRVYNCIWNDEKKKKKKKGGYKPFFQLHWKKL